VITGGLSSSSDGIPAVEFVRQLYASGARDFFDAIALHSYTYPDALTKDPNRRGEAIAQTHDIMLQHGNGGKKIWLTEYGQSTGLARGAVSENLPADILVDFLKWCARTPFLGPPFLFTSRDAGIDPLSLDIHYGLYRMDYAPKPVAAKLQSLSR
jgi:peptidoglycan/xylan/chitin deacetylase (PgdA/CDA1 family)